MHHPPGRGTLQHTRHNTRCNNIGLSMAAYPVRQPSDRLASLTLSPPRTGEDQRRRGSIPAAATVLTSIQSSPTTTCDHAPHNTHTAKLSPDGRDLSLRMITGISACSHGSSPGITLTLGPLTPSLICHRANACPRPGRGHAPPLDACRTVMGRQDTIAENTTSRYYDAGFVDRRPRRLHCPYPGPPSSTPTGR